MQPESRVRKFQLKRGKRKTMARRDDPRLGGRERVPSISRFPFRVRHLLLDHPTKPGYLTACRYMEVPASDAQWVEARQITCGICRSKYTNQ